MDEGTNKAIPLRRSRTRALTVRSRTWTDTVSAGVRRVLEPPRQVWLASLGGPALVVRGLREAWARLVAEGAAVEATLGLVLRRQPEAAGHTMKESAAP